MPPKPSQKGKFKPRKPAKKAKPIAVPTPIRAPDATTTAPTPTATVAFAPPTDNSTIRESQGSGQSGRGKGRGEGRSGKGGRGRAAIPSGRVFFTGSEKPAPSTTKRKSRTTQQIRKKKEEVEHVEEVVGQLDTAIGGKSESKSAPKKTTKSQERAMDYEETTINTTEQTAQISIPMQGVMYDSDSSREDEDNMEGRNTSRLEPLALPFPTEQLPIGIGSTKRPVAYPAANNAGQSIDSSEAFDVTGSPFANPENADNLTWEQDSWFLVQMPTRLPQLQSVRNDQPDPIMSANSPIHASSSTTEDQSNAIGAISEVATPPIIGNSHDNTLTQTAPGRLGKLIVYKSGRTVLKMEGPTGDPPILMDVNEGLTCSFLQEAVVLRPDKASYVGLGQVKKSIVVTPDLTSAYAQS